MLQTCIFCKIISREIPAQIIKETEDYIVIKDIAPKAPIHYLIIPKVHISSVAEIAHDQITLVGKLFTMAQELGKSLSPSAYRLLVNTGKEVGQSVFHLHAHFLAGKQLSDF